MYKDESISIQQTETQSSPQKNIFELIGSQSTYFKQKITVDFQAVKAIDPTITPLSLSTFSILPTLNQDRKYFTPAFINPFDYQCSDEKKRYDEHQFMVKLYSKEIPHEEILVPKPRESDYCCVCRIKYDDYLEHLESSKHTKIITKSKYSNLIHDLKQTYFKKNKRSQRLAKKLK